VNTGSQSVIEVNYRDPSIDPGSIDQLDRKQLKDIGEKYCPIAQHAVEKLLETLDPQGGSQASS